MRASAMVRTNAMPSIFSASASGVPGNGDQHVDRHAFGVLREVGQRHQHVDAVLRLLAHADDAAGANLDAGLAHARQRLQPVGEGARGDDLAVVALGRIDVVVVVVEAGALELADVVVREHAERHARLHAHRLDAFDHGAQHVHVAALGRAPGGAHAVAGGAGVLRLLGLGEHALDRHQLAGAEARGVVRRLAAIAAILGAAAGLDGQQAGCAARCSARSSGDGSSAP